MKNILLLITLTFCFKIYSQEATSVNFKKIKFEYTTKSNFEFDEKGVYASNKLFLQYFPTLQFTPAFSPTDNTKKTFFIPYSSFDEKQLETLRSKIYHTNVVTKSTYYPKTKTTESYCYYCADEETKKIMKFLKSGCNENKSFQFTTSYDNSHLIKTNNSFHESQKPIGEVLFQDDTKLLGSYESETKDLIITNIVKFDKDLIKYITPINIFSNSEFGVQKIFSFFYTVELTAIQYK